MAHRTDKSVLPDDGPYDGGLTCRLCPDPRPSEDNEWCPIAERVVCEDCCRALMLGDDRLRRAVAELNGGARTPDDVIAACVACERLGKLIEEHVPQHETDVRFPLH